MPIIATCKTNDTATSHKTDLGMEGRDGFAIERKCIRAANQARWSSKLFRRQANRTQRKWRLRFVVFRSCFRPSGAATEAVPQECPDGQPTIRVSNLLAFSGRTGCVTNRDFRNLLSHPAELGSGLRTEFETMALQANTRE